MLLSQLVRREDRDSPFTFLGLSFFCPAPAQIRRKQEVIAALYSLPLGFLEASTLLDRSYSECVSLVRFPLVTSWKKCV